MSHQLALQEIEKMSKVFKAFEEAKNALTSLASLDQNIKELNIEKDKILSSLEEEKKKLKDFITSSIEQKQRISEETKQEFIRLKMKQDREIETHQQNFDKTKKFFEDALLSLKKEADIKTETLANIQKKIEEKEEILASLETKVQQVKQQINKLLNN